MKKIVRITESDIKRIVKKTLKEGYGDDMNFRFKRKPKRPLIKQPTQDEIERAADMWYKSHERPKRPIVKQEENPNMEYNDQVLDEDMGYEMSGAAHRRDFDPTPREKDIMGVFGDFYGEDVPPVVIRYIRKNPDAILRRLSKVYPDIYMRHVPTEGTLDEAEYTVDPDDLEKVKGKFGPDDKVNVVDKS